MPTGISMQFYWGGKYGVQFDGDCFPLLPEDTVPLAPCHRFCKLWWKRQRERERESTWWPGRVVQAGLACRLAAVFRDISGLFRYVLGFCSGNLLLQAGLACQLAFGKPASQATMIIDSPNKNHGKQHKTETAVGSQQRTSCGGMS